MQSNSMPGPEGLPPSPFKGEATVSPRGKLTDFTLGQTVEAVDPFATLVTNPDDLQTNPPTSEQPHTLAEKPQRKGLGRTVVEFAGKVLKNKRVRGGAALAVVTLSTMGANAECGDGGIQERQQQRRIRDLQDGPANDREGAAERDRQRREDNRRARESRKQEREERNRSNN